MLFSSQEHLDLISTCSLQLPVCYLLQEKTKCQTINAMDKDQLLKEIYFEYTRSRGAGGQHVNRTESAAVLRWSLTYTQAFTEVELHRLQNKLADRLTSEGEILIRSETSRDRNSNQKESIQKFLRLIESCLRVPKRRIPTKPTRSSQRERLNEKKKHGEKKLMRGKKGYDE